MRWLGASFVFAAVASAAVPYRACAVGRMASVPQTQHPAVAPASVHGVDQAASARARTPSQRSGPCHCLLLPRVVCAACTLQCALKGSAAASFAFGGHELLIQRSVVPVLYAVS
jgi:hypothetical protein